MIRGAKSVSFHSLGRKRARAPLQPDRSERLPDDLCLSEPRTTVGPDR